MRQDTSELGRRLVVGEKIERGANRVIDGLTKGLQHEAEPAHRDSRLAGPAHGHEPLDGPLEHRCEIRATGR